MEKGQVLEKKIKSGNNEIILRANYVEKRTDTFIIELSWSPGELSFAEVLHTAGAIPFHPILKEVLRNRILKDTRLFMHGMMVP